MPEPSKQRPGDQPLPVVNDQTDIQTLMIREIEKRREVGIERYGTALQPFNGRNAAQDLFEEMIDGAAYALQIRVEMDAMQERIRELLEELMAFAHFVSLRADGEVLQAANAIRRGEPFVERES